MQFATPPPKTTLSHWLFFLGYVPYLELRLVLKLSDVWASFAFTHQTFHPQKTENDEQNLEKKTWKFSSPEDSCLDLRMCPHCC